jgi:hypothetical protein
MTTASAPAVEICLTGTDDGAGYAAFLGEGKWVGDAEPKAGRSLEEAFWLAVAHLRVAGIVEGEALVVDPASRWVAEIELDAPLVRYGMLVWSPAPIWFEADRSGRDAAHAA